MSSSISNTTSADPSKTSGQLHSVKGTVVETIGNLTGSPAWQTSGKEEHVAGETEYNAAQAKGYVQGTVDRVSGKADTIVGAVTGDRQKELAGNAKQDKGTAQQTVNKS